MDRRQLSIMSSTEKSLQGPYSGTHKSRCPKCKSYKVASPLDYSFGGIDKHDIYKTLPDGTTTYLGHYDLTGNWHPYPDLTGTGNDPLLPFLAAPTPF